MAGGGQNRAVPQRVRRRHRAPRLLSRRSWRKRRFSRRCFSRTRGRGTALMARASGRCRRLGRLSQGRPATESAPRQSDEPRPMPSRWRSTRDRCASTARRSTRSRLRPRPRPLRGTAMLVTVPRTGASLQGVATLRTGKASPPSRHQASAGSGAAQWSLLPDAPFFSKRTSTATAVNRWPPPTSTIPCCRGMPPKKAGMRHVCVTIRRTVQVFATAKSSKRASSGASSRLHPPHHPLLWRQPAAPRPTKHPREGEA
mmetsp:Transcript_3193/g.7765  ORF Transcript_3193/g.7765 Transcript_3193/m.7765 type:complete len:257 (-) Transcript_3193:988-1758(-)